MPKYKCVNPKCLLHNKIKGRTSRGYYDKKLQRITDSGLTCPGCGEDTELQLPEYYSRNLKNRP